MVIHWQIHQVLKRAQLSYAKTNRNIQKTYLLATTKQHVKQSLPPSQQKNSGTAPCQWAKETGVRLPILEADNILF